MKYPARSVKQGFGYNRRAQMIIRHRKMWNLFMRVRKTEKLRNHAGYLNLVPRKHQNIIDPLIRGGLVDELIHSLW